MFPLTTNSTIFQWHLIVILVKQQGRGIWASFAMRGRENGQTINIDLPGWTSPTAVADSGRTNRMDAVTAQHRHSNLSGLIIMDAATNSIIWRAKFQNTLTLQPFASLTFEKKTKHHTNPPSKKESKFIQTYIGFRLWWWGGIVENFGVDNRNPNIVTSNRPNWEKQRHSCPTVVLNTTASFSLLRSPAKPFKHLPGNRVNEDFCLNNSHNF